MYSMEKLANDFCKLGIRAGQQLLHLVQKLLSTRLPAITSEYTLRCQALLVHRNSPHRP